MRSTEKTLLEQLRVTDFEIAQRKKMLFFDAQDAELLAKIRPIIDNEVDQIVDDFYQIQVGIPEIELLIGDADTLQRLRKEQRRYILDLFSGLYDLDYVNNRLRIGLVHKRIGVEPKLYLSAVCKLTELLKSCIRRALADDIERKNKVFAALDKIFFFDITLVFETYIRSMVSEIEATKSKTEIYAQALEQIVHDRTMQLEELSRTDPLTGIMNRRLLDEYMIRAIRAAQRRHEPVSLVYFDVDSFKQINDLQGHAAGDEVLRVIGDVLKMICRADDYCFRYGGDEFCVVLTNTDERRAHDDFCERLHRELARQLPDVKLSIGICSTGPQEYCTPEKLLREADDRMYSTKKARKAARESANP